MKKWINLLFCGLFLLSITIPLLTMDFRKNQESEIDNAYLPELDRISEDGLAYTIETYVSKRIGFRKEALTVFQKINDTIFGLMEHPNYMYGSDGYVFNRGIEHYQHLNLNQEEAEQFAQALAGFQKYAQSRGKDFLYWLIPNKETVYPEFYPQSIHVLGDISYTDQVLTALQKYGVNHHYAKDAMLEGKNKFQVNNIKFDAGHWNAHGAFVSCQDLYSIIYQRYPDVESIHAAEYNVEMVEIKSLDTSYFEINEMVPKYSLKKQTAEDQTSWLKGNIFLSFENNYAFHYVNENCKDAPKLLFLSDSYIQPYPEFFIEKFSQTTFIHRYNCLNQEAFEYYVDLLDPDIIIFENPERSMPIDLYQDFSRP